MPKTLTDCRLTVAGQVDASSIASIVRGVLAPLPAGATDEQKVLALYRYVREHMFVFPCVPDDLHEDFNKALHVLNWWGYGLCGTHAKVLGVLAAHLLGRENVRLMGMSEVEPGAWLAEQRGAKAFVWTMRSKTFRPYQGQGHTSLEVRWGGSWHFLDVMVGFYRRDAAGRIVSLEEIIAEPSLADRAVGDPEGDMPYGPEPEIFTRARIGFQAVNFNAWPGRPLPLNLRPGERFTWLAEPIPGAYFLHPKIRRRFGSDALAPGPRGHRPDRPVPRWGNGRHDFAVRLAPEASDPYWCPETADWHVPVELPLPVLSICWEMDAGCEGFLFHCPTTGDTLLPIKAAGCQHLGENDWPGRRYRIIVRAPDRRGPANLALRTIVQQNPRVVHKPRNGVNAVRLSGEGEGKLTARLAWLIDGREQSAELSGVGEHTVVLPETGEVTGQTVTLANEG